VSRGHGKAQQFVLDTLERRQADNVHPRERWRDPATLAHERHEREPTEAEVESIRRAIRKLGEEGLLETRHVDAFRDIPTTAQRRKWDEASGEFTDEVETYDTYRRRGFRMLQARLPLTAAERKRDRKAESEWQERVEAVFRRRAERNGSDA